MRSGELTPEERRASLLGMLLGSDEPIKLRALASRSKVSVGTVGRDLDEAEEWLATYGLTLQDLDEAAFLSGSEGTDGRPGGATDLVSAGLMGMIDSGRLQTAKALTRESVGRLPYAIADEAFVSLSVHVALMIERLLRDGEIELDAEVLERLRETAEYENARELAGAIGERFQVDVPEEEVAYLTRHLRGTKLRQDDELDRYFEGSDLEIASRVKALIHHISEQTGVALAGDSSLYTGLLAHIERAIHRLRENMRISNPLLAEMKEDYPALFDLVDRGMKKIFVEDEI